MNETPALAPELAPRHETPDDAPEIRLGVGEAQGPFTMTIDIGGTGLKAGLLDVSGALISKRVRIETPHPSPPDVVMPLLLELAGQVGAFDRISVGFPGVVRDGRVLTAPNLGTKEWAGFALADALSDRLGKPVRLENDAAVQGLGVISGEGLECVMTLGTGVGFALYKDGRLAPHLELSQHVIHGKKTYDEYLGVAELERIGKKHWRKRVGKMLKQVRTLVNFDKLYIGGGDARLLKDDLPPDVHVVSNDSGITGGVRLWDSRLDLDYTTVHGPHVISVES